MPRCEKTEPCLWGQQMMKSAFASAQSDQRLFLFAVSCAGPESFFQRGSNFVNVFLLSCVDE